MAKTELTLRPGDSLSIKLELAGQALRLDLKLLHDGLVMAPPPARPGTRQVMPPPVALVAPPSPAHALHEVQDEPAGGEEDAATVQETDHEIDFDMGDLEGEQEEVTHEQADFSAHALTMPPPAQDIEEPRSMEPESGEFLAGPRKATRTVQPNHTLPPWSGTARDYRDPVLEKKKRTSGVVKKADAWGEGEMAPAPGGQDTLFAAGPAMAPKALPESGGDYTVFLTPPKTEQKKQAAARIIAQVQGISESDALALADRMIVPVVKNVTEKEAHGVRDQFKGVGLSCRITQKR